MQVIALFETLARAVEGNFGLALAGSAAWGVASVLLSPCHEDDSFPVISCLGFDDDVMGREDAPPPKVGGWLARERPSPSPLQLR
jgi:hypothetical protein